MNHSSVFNREFFNFSNLDGLSKAFDNGRPFRYVVIDNFQNEKFANEIESSFPSSKEMQKNYYELNEKKSDDSNFQHLPKCFTLLKNALAELDFVNCIESITSLKNTHTLNWVVDCTREEMKVFLISISTIIFILFTIYSAN